MALSRCPLLGLKRTRLMHARMSANDPKRTSRLDRCEQISCGQPLDKTGCDLADLLSLRLCQVPHEFIEVETGRLLPRRIVLKGREELAHFSSALGGRSLHLG